MTRITDAQVKVVLKALKECVGLPYIDKARYILEALARAGHLPGADFCD